MSPRSKTEVRRTLRAFALELVLYAGLVVVYFFAVLHFLGGWLVQLETSNRLRPACCVSCAEVAPNNVFPDLTGAR